MNAIPFPENLNFTQPDPALPQELRAFVGKFKGQWHSTRYRNECTGPEAIIAVTQISKTNAAVTYAWNAYSVFDRNVDAGVVQIKGKFIRQGNLFILTFSGQSGNTFKFYFPVANNKQMKGSLTFQGMNDEWVVQMEAIS